MHATVKFFLFGKLISITAPSFMESIFGKRVVPSDSVVNGLR